MQAHRPQTFTLFTYSFINDSLLQTIPYLNQLLLQFALITIFTDHCCVVLQTFSQQDSDLGY